jgi:hypothetical protein
MNQVKLSTQEKQGFSKTTLLLAVLGVFIIACFAGSLMLKYEPGSIFSFILGVIVGTIIVIVGNALRPGSIRYSKAAVIIYILLAALMLSAFIYSVLTGNTYSPVSNLIYGVILGNELAILYYTLRSRKQIG